MVAILSDYVKVLKTLLLNPYEMTKRTMTIRESLLYYWRGILIPTLFIVALILLLYFYITYGFGFSDQAFSFEYDAVEVVVGLLAVLPVCLFISAFIAQFLGKNLFKDFTNGYSNTFCALIYGATSWISVIWIPQVGNLLSVLGGTVFVFALSNQQKITTNKAFRTLLITLIITALLFVVAVIASLNLNIGAGQPQMNFSCTAIGLSCTGLNYSHVTGNLTMIITQNSGQDWINVSIAFVPSGSSYNWSSTENTYSIPDTLQSGKQVVVTIPVSGPVPKGQQTMGVIWLKYQKDAAASLTIFGTPQITLVST